MHVDGFLYENDDIIDELCDEGKMARNYCSECGSHKTKPLSMTKRERWKERRERRERRENRESRERREMEGVEG